MKINKDNYEIYFLDYHEGSLPAELVAELFLFLEKNPGLKPEFESFENISLPEQSSISFPDKALLKKGSIDESNYTNFFIAYVEGTLNEDEKLMLAKFLVSFPGYKKELSLFEKTKLQPDFAIVYPDKKDLKKPVPLFAQPKTWYYLAAAACILFFLGLFFMNQERNNELQMAHRDKPGIKDQSIAPVKNSVPQKKNNLQNEKEIKLQTEKNKSNSRNIEKAVEQELNNDSQKQIAQQNIHNPKKNYKLKLKEINPEIKEEIALMQPVEIKLSVNEIETSLADSHRAPKSNPYYTLTASTSEQTPYMTVSEALRHYSQNKFKEVMNDKPLTDDLMSQRVPVKIKGIKFMGWCYEKITGKKVDVNTSYNPQGELTAYHVSAGRFQFGKTFASR